MKIFLLLLGFTCFGAGEDIYKVPEDKPRIFFDGTMWRTLSVAKQTTIQRARRLLPDLSELFEMSNAGTTQEIQGLEKDTTFNASVNNLISKIMEGIKTGLSNSNIREVLTIQTTTRPYPLHLFDWLLTSTTTTTKSYLAFLDATTDRDPHDLQTIDAADLWYGTEPTRKHKPSHSNIETKSSRVPFSTETTPQSTIIKQMSISFNNTTPNHKKVFSRRIKNLYDLLASYKEGLNRTSTTKEEKLNSHNKTTPRTAQDNSQIQSQIDDLKDNRNKLIALILDLLSRLKVILARKSKSDGYFENKNAEDIQKIIIKKKKEPMNARKVAQQADLLFSELSYDIDLGNEDVLSETEIIGDMEDIDVRNEKYMSRMFGLNDNDPKETINQKEIYDYSQFENPADRRGGVEYDRRYKIIREQKETTS